MLKTIQHIAIFLLLVGTTSQTLGQSFMVLEKMGTKKRYVYYIGQSITYREKNATEFEYGTITNLLDSAFTVANDTVLFKNVAQVNISNKRHSPLLAMAGPTLISAGVVLLAIDVINRGIVQGGGYTWEPAIGTASVALVTAGGLILLLKKNKKKLGDKAWWRLRKVEVY